MRDAAWVRVTIEVGGHTVTLEVAPSRNMPDKYDELSVWTDRQTTGPGWTTDLAKEPKA